MKTILASGNVIFDASGSEKMLEKKLEEILKKKWKRDIFVMVRSIDRLQKLVARNPFKGIKVTPLTRLYITFLKGEPKSRLKLPHRAKEHDFTVLLECDYALFSHLEINPKTQTPDVMKIIDQTYGKMMTTRNWNTIQKILTA